MGPVGTEVRMVVSYANEHPRIDLELRHRRGLARVLRPKIGRLQRPLFLRDGEESRVRKITMRLKSLKRKVLILAIVGLDYTTQVLLRLL